MNTGKKRVKGWALESCRYILSFLLLMLFALSGKWLQDSLSLPIPGSVIGMAVLFLCLKWKIIPVQFIRPAGHLFLQYMVLLLIPACVAIVNYLDLINGQMTAILFSTAGASAIVLVVMSLWIDRTIKVKENK